jgi:hypothetical protein
MFVIAKNEAIPKFVTKINSLLRTIVLELVNFYRNDKIGWLQAGWLHTV